MRLLVVVSRYSVLAVIWMALSTTAHAQSTSCISSPDGNGGAVINCTTTSWGADRMSQSNTNCLRSSDGSGGSIANCTTNSYNYGSNAPTRGWLWGIAQGAASASDGWASYRAAHPNYVYPTPLSSLLSSTFHHGGRMPRGCGHLLRQRRKRRMVVQCRGLHLRPSFCEGHVFDPHYLSQQRSVHRKHFGRRRRQNHCHLCQGCQGLQQHVQGEHTEGRETVRRLG